MSNYSTLESIFFAALEKESPAELSAYLDAACATDSGLRRRIERMLAAQTEAGSFLEQPVIADDITLNHDPIVSEEPGSLIGPYKLLQQIGEGGMGVVFMAEQSYPVQRTVALKIIKPGMDTRQVIARFEAERQALAMMDHPNIARVVDAGTTDTGRPYFVMDLVKGIPITSYCDEQHLSVRQRLELFTQVCQAIQHAHQKGIIHRDLKPSNVLVAEYDGKPVPKVIDFGVAKATAQKLTERTMFTEFGQVIGTVEYMSPEQARFNQLDVDTRSDIYSLGVLLYELLSGETPFDRKRLRSAAFDEVLRIIREEDPPRPSTRLSSQFLRGSVELAVTSDSATVAANRQSEPARLSKELSGELDWIVMKCLEKDRNRRYETASSLAQDIGNYLSDEAVQACPPSATYRLRKFARRNKGPIVVASSAFAVLIVMIAGLAISNRMIATQRSIAEKNFQQARKTVDDYLTLVSQTKLLDVSGLQPLRKELLELALSYYKDFAKTHAGDPAVTSELAAAYFRMGTIESLIGADSDAIKALEEAVRLWNTLPEQKTNLETKANLASAYTNIAMLENKAGASEEVLKLYRNAERLWRDLVDENPNDIDCRLSLARTLDQLALALCQIGPLPEALSLQDEAFRHFKAASDASSLDVNSQRYLAGHLVNAAVVYARSDDRKQVKESLDRAREILKNCCELSPRNLPCQRQMSDVYMRLGRLQLDSKQLSQAAALFGTACKIQKPLVLQNPTLTDVQRDYAIMLCELGKVQVGLGNASEAVDALMNAEDLLSVPVISESTDELAKQLRIQCLLTLAMAQVRSGNVGDAIQTHASACKLLDGLQTDEPGNDSWLDKSAAIEQFAGSLRDEGHYSEAALMFQGLWELVCRNRGKDHPSAAIALGQLALAQAAAGNDASYRIVCEKLLEGFGNTLDPDIANIVAWSCTLRPNATSKPENVVRLAEIALVSDDSNRNYLYALGAAEFRAGRLEKAAETLQKAINASNSDSDISDGFLLAMIYHQQGNGTESQRWLNESTNSIQHSQSSRTSSGVDGNRKAIDSIEERLLYSEAEQLLGRTSSP